MTLAFYDFDNTVIHGDAGPLLGAHLFKRRRQRITEKHAAAVAAARKVALWTGLVPYATSMALRVALYKVRAIRRSDLVRSAYRGFRRVPVPVLEAVLDDFVEAQIAPRIYPEVIDTMRRHVAAGGRCIIITTGMQRLVERCLPYFPPGTEVLGCTLEEANDRLTGRVRNGPLYGADKANIIVAYCKAAGIDPKACSAYSDHFSDHHMLDVVGHGVCINPAPRLARLAAKRGWDVLRLGDPRRD